jgi:hypothetical protein
VVSGIEGDEEEPCGADAALAGDASGLSGRDSVILGHRRRGRGWGTRDHTLRCLARPVSIVIAASTAPAASSTTVPPGARSA